MEGSSHLREVADEPPVIRGESQEATQFCRARGGRPLHDRANLGRISSYATARNDMPQKGNTLFEELALLGVQLQVGCT